MGRSLVVALGIAGALACSLAGCGGATSAGDHVSATPTATPLPVVAPAIPCSSSGKPKTPDPTPTPSASTWTGVFERVTAHLENDGSLKKSARQLTRVSAEGSGPVTVAVPMSDKRLHKRDKGKKPSFSNGMAHVSLDPSGTKAQEFDSDFEGSLPVAVKVSVKLDGKPVSVSDVKHKSGTVEVAYQLTNTTAKPVTVCFKGFNGATTKQTVSTPHPIIAYLSFTVPSGATTIHAPGASLAPARKGVSASWTTAMFPPLGKTSQTFTFTMDTSKAEVPEAHVLLETLNPLSPAGTLPQKSAAAVGQAAAAADKATAQVQSDIAALQTRSSQPKHPHSSARGGGLSFGTPTSALTTMQSQIGRLGRANFTFIANVNAPTRGLFPTTRRSVDGVAGTARRAIDGSSTTVGRVVRRLNASIDRSLGGFTASMGKTVAALAADLRRATSTPSLLAITASAAKLQLATTEIRHHADKVAAEVAPVAARIDELVTGLQAPVQSSADLVQRLVKVSSDLGALNGADKNDPTFLELVADVAQAQKVATDVHGALADLQQRAQAVAADVHGLQADVVGLQNQVTGLEAAALANAQGTIQGQLTTAVAAVDARVGKAEATAAREVANAEMTAVRTVQTDGQKARQSVASAAAGAKQTVSAADARAQRGLTAAVRKAQRTVLSSERSVTATLTSVQEKAKRALATAKQKAKAGGQASLAAAQAASAQAAAAVGDAVASANAHYARLLTSNEVAVANQLPGGDAPGVTEQNGSFRYVIKGT